MILQINGKKVVEVDDLARLVAEHEPGEKVKVTILHDNKREQVEVTLGKRPDIPGEG